jgi:crotonobetainyl-CoA:carnitine CoA-transferase CaiB-like acyl-CoA transferase
MDRAARRGNIPYRDLPLSVADTNASLHGLVALLSAVILRQRTGTGQHIDLAMIDATVVTDDQLHYELEDSEATGPLRNDAWETAVGPVLVSADIRYFWHLLSTQLGLPDPTTPDMDRDARIVARRHAVREFMLSLASWEQIEAVMAQMNLAWGRVRSGATLRDQPTIAFRRTIVDVDDRAGGTRPIPQSPYRFSDARSGVRGPAPHRGEHNHEVLGEWLGKSAEAIDALHGSAVLRHDEETLG